MTTVLADPAKMIAKGAPHVIHNDAELAAYTEVLFRLTSLARPSRSEEDAIELLTLLIERYEETNYPTSFRRRDFRRAVSSGTPESDAARLNS